MILIEYIETDMRYLQDIDPVWSPGFSHWEFAANPFERRMAENLAPGLGELYINAGLQLQIRAMKVKSSLCAIRRAEHFAKCVRLSAHHALLARELGTQH